MGETRLARALWMLSIAAAAFVGGWLSQFLPK